MVVRELPGRMSGDKAKVRTGNMVEFQHDVGRSWADAVVGSKLHSGLE
jgi:hypothetical protein